jgi:hypothetical protein
MPSSGRAWALDGHGGAVWLLHKPNLSMAADLMSMTIRSGLWSRRIALVSPAPRPSDPPQELDDGGGVDLRAGDGWVSESHPWSLSRDGIEANASVREVLDSADCGTGDGVGSWSALRALYLFCEGCSQMLAGATQPCFYSVVADSQAGSGFGCRQALTETKNDDLGLTFGQSANSQRRSASQNRYVEDICRLDWAGEGLKDGIGSVDDWFSPTPDVEACVASHGEDPCSDGGIASESGQTLEDALVNFLGSVFNLAGCQHPVGATQQPSLVADEKFSEPTWIVVQRGRHQFFVGENVPGGPGRFSHHGLESRIGVPDCPIVATACSCSYSS